MTITDNIIDKWAEEIFGINPHEDFFIEDLKREINEVVNNGDRS